MMTDLHKKLAETLKANGHDTINGTAQQIGVAMSTLHTYVQNGKIKAIEVGRYRYINVEEARALIPEINKNREKVTHMRHGLPSRIQIPEEQIEQQLGPIGLEVDQVIEKLKPEIELIVRKALTDLMLEHDFRAVLAGLMEGAVRAAFQS